MPQLFHGLAGLGNALLDIHELDGDERYLAEAWQVAEGVLLFSVSIDRRASPIPESRHFERAPISQPVPQELACSSTGSTAPTPGTVPTSISSSTSSSQNGLAGA